MADKMTKKRGQDGQEQVKHLSCRRCRVRKIKCSQELPCANCIKAKVECEQTTTDKRSKRPAANYVAELETHIKNLQDIWGKVVKAKGSDRDDLIQLTTEFYKGPREISDDSLQTGETTNGAHHRMDTTTSLNSTNSTVSERADARVVYGPMSVHSDLITNPLQILNYDHSTIASLNQDQDILHCVKTFFIWQYPDHNMFLFREAFLEDFLNPTKDSQYCSKALVLSICALGARMSEVDRIYSRAQGFYNEARALLLSKLDHPLITSMQSFLLLAFYDICNGSNSSGWMLSGNAFRMGYDIGFQLNPELWFMRSKDGSGLSSLDLAIRSRIYWGSYIADHFISLLLGRPSLLKMSEATIPATDYLPDLEWIDEYMYLDPENKDKVKQDQSNISLPLKNVIKLINISDSMLTDIFTRTELEISASADGDGDHDDLDITSRLEKLSQYNIKIKEWKKYLPDDLSWDREHLSNIGDNPVMLCIRYYYYILVLCLNRPFVAVVPKKHHHKDIGLQPSQICEEAIDDLRTVIEKFASSHGLRKASIFIVYCSILAVSVLLLTNKSKQLVNNKKEKLEFFMNVLLGCSKTWNLAEKSYNLIRIKLHSLEEEERRDKEETPVPLPEIRVKSENGHALLNAPSPRTFHRRTSIAVLNDIKMDHNSPPNMGEGSPSQNTHIHGQHLQPPNIAAILDGAMRSTSQLDVDENLDFFGGPPVLMTSDLFNEDWEALFPDYMFNSNN